MPLSTALLIGAVLIAGLALAAATLALWRPAERKGGAQIVLVGLALALQTGAIVLRAFEAGTIPLRGLQEGLVFTAWALLVGFLLLQWRARLPALGAFLLPLVVGLDLAGLIMAGVVGPAVAETYRPHWLTLHASLSFLGLASFGLVFALSAMYLLQERSLRTRHVSRLGRILPSLERTDRLIYQALAVGFPLLTLGIFSGLFWLATRPAAVSIPSIKVVFPLLAWTLFAVVLWARVVAGWRGRKLAWAAIAGFLLAMTTLLGLTP